MISWRQTTRETTRVVEHPAEPSYPALARQTNVQGSVLLLAHIGKDGNVQDVQLLSGPEILLDAAREAVKQWHFKPQYRSEQPIETDSCTLYPGLTSQRYRP